jgi:hypothetical protein
LRKGNSAQFDLIPAHFGKSAKAKVLRGNNGKISSAQFCQNWLNFGTFVAKAGNKICGW